MNLGLFFICGVLGVALGQLGRFLGKEWHLWEVWFAFCLLVLGSSVYVIGVGDSEDPLHSLLATLCGGLLMAGYILRRGDSRSLALDQLPWKKMWWGIAVATVNVILAVLWIISLQGLGFQAESQTIVRQIQSSSPLEWRIFFCFVVFGAPFIEELFFRGFFWHALKSHIQPRWIIFWTAFMFGLIHFDTPHAVIPLTVFGLGLGWLRWKSQSLWLPILAHSCNNAWVILNIEIYS